MLIPPAVQAIWDSRSNSSTPVDLALQWLWNQSDVSLVLGGMSNLEQTKQNVQSAGRSAIGSLKQQDLELLGEIKRQYQKIRPISCTKCRCCLPCPVGIDIPYIFEIFNDLKAYQGNNLVLNKVL